MRLLAGRSQTPYTAMRSRNRRSRQARKTTWRENPQSLHVKLSDEVTIDGASTSSARLDMQRRPRASAQLGGKWQANGEARAFALLARDLDLPVVEVDGGLNQIETDAGADDPETLPPR